MSEAGEPSNHQNACLRECTKHQISKCRIAPTACTLFRLVCQSLCISSLSLVNWRHNVPSVIPCIVLLIATCLICFLPNFSDKPTLNSAALRRH